MASPLRGDGEHVPTSDSGTVTMPHGLKMPNADRLAPVLDAPLHVPGSGRAPAFWMVGAHGGSGASSLARAWAPAGDALRTWPAADRYPLAVIVARTHITGLLAAHDLVLQATAHRIGGCAFLGVVTVADTPGKLPSTLRRKHSLLATAVHTAGGRMWQIPYLDAYRVVDPAQLPIWDPTAVTPELPGRRWRRTEAPDQVAPEIATVGAEIFAAAAAAR
ncbi:DUF6668 family protein [Rhodococcus artemisiae]|uniref:Uncharacterized protein n=1 Tax=Rhodococcus artemisiae TaxID=714159 RepID=A0ABU7LKS0_9NOCA|nr:DUF6668 family protein [Rhodococcus artemisiae]MEE2061822.1 hypothetical protein [Rhodococcus artemisiae]